MVDLFYLFLLALLGSIIALVGGVFFLFNRKWSATLEKYSVPFAAGVLITVALLGILPEAIDLVGEGVLLVILVSFFAAYLFEHMFFGIHHHGVMHYHHRDYAPVIPLVILGDSIHNFIDGIAIGASFLISPGLGLITALSTFFHEVPHEIGDFGILLKAGWRKSKILTVNVLSASFTIVGAFSLLLFSENKGAIGMFLGISTGIFLYLGTIDFLPHADEGFPSRVKAVIPLFIGVLVMALTILLFPHAD
ncbi:hypothetical protein A2125_00165 [Candidatus Woesebacteria bacterium GWB1_43_5]|uniref:ZIP family metal transporter n=1 Tax=Candidatus Woesebacteria bacterium GWB1_43_5 TaxID=1802474 RepID=A0A1F7WUD4_9BACT|nr:MAG: hypothetical protein A2125_00165 [Candidatus Woesebacteria bacterium GWB1_43_5]